MSLIKRKVPKREIFSPPTPVMFQKLDVRNTLVNLRRKSFPPFDYKTFPLEGGEGYGDLMVMVDASASMEDFQFKFACELGYGLGKRVFAGSAIDYHAGFFYQEIFPDTAFIYTGGENVDYALDDICSALSINHILYVTDAEIVGGKTVNRIYMKPYVRKATYITIACNIDTYGDYENIIVQGSWLPIHYHNDEKIYAMSSVVVPHSKNEEVRKEMLAYLIKYRPWTEGGIVVVWKKENKWTHRRVPDDILIYNNRRVHSSPPTTDCDYTCDGDFRSLYLETLTKGEII